MVPGHPLVAGPHPALARTQASDREMKLMERADAPAGGATGPGEVSDGAGDEGTDGPDETVADGGGEVDDVALLTLALQPATSINQARQPAAAIVRPMFVLRVASV